MNDSVRVRQRFESLSPRQREIALFLADGFTNGDIALRLEVTVHTVKAHRAEVMRRMEADSFAELVTYVRYLHPVQATSSAESHEALYVIVVEDDPWYREYLTDNLNSHAFTAIGVAGSAEFWATWEQGPANIVMLDIELGSDLEDGFAIAAELRKRSDCGIVMVTAKGETADRLAGLGIGADAYFSKPVNIGELTITLSNLGRRLR